VGRSWSMFSNCAHVVAPSCRPPAHCIKFGYVVVKYVWAASRVQSLVSPAAHRRQMDPHRRGRRPQSFLRNANKCKVYFCLWQWSTSVRKGRSERVSTPSVTSCTLYILHESEAQPKTATRIHLPIHLGNTPMKKIGGSPLSRAQGRAQRRILRRSRLGPEAHQNMNNVHVRLLRRARTVNKPPGRVHLRLLKDEERRWHAP
jgi:hypothetical protein